MTSEFYTHIIYIKIYLKENLHCIVSFNIYLYSICLKYTII